DAFALHLLLQDPESLFDIVVAYENLQFKFLYLGGERGGVVTARASTGRAMQSSSRDRMHRKAIDDELVLCRDIPRRLARRSPCCNAGNTCRFRDYRCNLTFHGGSAAG